MTKYITVGLSLIAIGLLVTTAWLNSSLRAEREAHNITRADNVRLMVATAAQEKALRDLRGELIAQSVLLAERDARVTKYNEAAYDAAIAIQGAANDSPNCNIDDLLPDSLSNPLRLLYSQASGGDGASGRDGTAATRTLSTQTDAIPASGHDNAKPGPVDGQAHAVGQ